MDYKGKKVLVCGLARSGIASAVLLIGLGAEVTVQDILGEEELARQNIDLDGLKQKGVRLYLGQNPDGILHKYDLLVLSPGIPTNLAFIEKARELGIPVRGEIELAYDLCPCPIIAVTGTNGKTTTVALTGEIMEGCAGDVAVVGNIGIPFTEKVSALKPDSLVVAEISSFQLETVHSFRPHISAVLNLTPDHLDRHGTLENYQAIKEKIFENQQTSDFTILNYDDEYCRDMATRTKAKVVYFSLNHELEEGFFYRDGSLRIRMDGFDEKIVGKKDLNILGSHNIENALAASAMAYCAGAGLEVIRKGLRTFQAVEHRIEFVKMVDGVSYYNDSKATNTDAAIKSIEAMESPIILIGGGYDKKVDFSPWVGRFKGRVKYLILLGATAEQIMETCEKYDFHKYRLVETLRQAVTLASQKAGPGDCVLLSPACASWGMFKDYEERGRQFKELVIEL